MLEEPPPLEPRLARLEAGTGEDEAALRQPHIGGTTAKEDELQPKDADIYPFISGLVGGEGETPWSEKRRGDILFLLFCGLTRRCLNPGLARVCLRDPVCSARSG